MESPKCLTVVALLLAASCAGSQATSVAVIGGGVGGAVTAYELGQLLAHEVPGLRVTVFERRAAVGGRARELAYGGPGHAPLEAGASIVHGSNRHFLELAARMNLTASPVRDSGGGALGVWDGRRLVFTQSGRPVIDLFRVLRRYGLAPIKYGRLARDAGRRFSQIYDLQRAGRAFDDPGALLRALGLWELTQANARQHLLDNLRGPWRFGAAAFAEELAGAVDRVNYNQGIGAMSALAALVSYLPAADPDVYRLERGNAALPAALLAAAAGAGWAELRLGEEVMGVAKLPGGGYTINSSAGAAGPFDAVVIAAPLEGSGISLSGLDPPPRLPGRRYQETVTTFVEGALNGATFQGLPEGADVFATAGAPTKISSISRHGPCAASPPGASTHTPPRRTAGRGGRAAPPEAALAPRTAPAATAAPAPPAGAAGGCTLFKVFSSGAPLSPADLAALFSNGSAAVASVRWAGAYPVFRPPEAFAPFALAPGLVYCSALENAASAMEVAAVAGVNSALLVAQHLRQLGAAAPATPAAAGRAGGRFSGRSGASGAPRRSEPPGAQARPLRPS